MIITNTNNLDSARSKSEKNTKTPCFRPITLTYDVSTLSLTLVLVSRVQNGPDARVFSRAFHRLHQCASNSDRFIELLAVRSSYDTSTSFLLKRLHWDNLSTRRKKLKATLTFKTIKGISPMYLQNLF